MNELHFYPTITNELIEDAGCACGAYRLSYTYEKKDYPLKTKGRNPVKIDNDAWKIEKDGLIIERDVTIEDIGKFKGPDGLVCNAADLGICIIWNNRALCQIGHIKPTVKKIDGQRVTFSFCDEFLPRSVKDDLTLDTIVYVEHAADRVESGEEKLMNEAGVSLGTLDSVTFLFSNDYMEFPIKEVKDKDKPLWWLELNQGDDPRIAQFSEDSVCLYLNQNYSYCPKFDERIKNYELLIEIISTAYLMIILSIKEADALDDTINDNNLEPGSISKVIHYFLANCDSRINYDSIADMQRVIRSQVLAMLGDDEQ